MDIEKEIREEWYTAKKQFIDAYTGKVSLKGIEDWWITRLHTLLERQVDSVLKIANDHYYSFCSAHKEFDVTCKQCGAAHFDMANFQARILSLQPTLKDNHQEE